jgi:hypothetical protein
MAAGMTGGDAIDNNQPPLGALEGGCDAQTEMIPQVVASEAKSGYK